MRAGLAFGVAVVLCAALTTGLANAETPTCRSGVFDSAFVAELDELAGDLAVTASVTDTRSGCTYELRPELVLTTASAIKLQVLGANLDRVENLGRSFTETEQRNAGRMMWYSHNSPPTGALYGQVGTSGMAAYSAAAGAQGMQHSTNYGTTKSTAGALTQIALATLHDASPGPLTAQSRATARSITDQIHPTQRWGISAGLPEGWTSHLKNGFFPCTSCAPFNGVYTWRVASTGFNTNAGGREGYAMSILTAGASTQAEGVEVVEFVARHVASALTSGEIAVRPYDSANCTTVLRGDAASSITERLGLATADWTGVRWISGNEGPLRGQLMCGDEPAAQVQTCICPTGLADRADRLLR